MRIIVKFGDLMISFENLARIIDYDDHITFVGDLVLLILNGMQICSMSTVTIQKCWLLAADEVYLDTRIKEVN